VYAPLRGQDAVKRYAEEARHAYGMNVQIRVGLHSGEVVVRKLAELTGLPFTLGDQQVRRAPAHDDLVMARPSRQDRSDAD
jgi:class 3 adenylate cyclase